MRSGPRDLDKRTIFLFILIWYHSLKKMFLARQTSLPTRQCWNDQNHDRNVWASEGWPNLSWDFEPHHFHWLAKLATDKTERNIEYREKSLQYSDILYYLSVKMSERIWRKTYLLSVCLQGLFYIQNETYFWHCYIIQPIRLENSY